MVFEAVPVDFKAAEKPAEIAALINNAVADAQYLGHLILQSNYRPDFPGGLVLFVEREVDVEQNS